MGNADEETDEPLIADHRNFYKVEKWSRDGERVTELLFAGSNLDKAKRVFDRWAGHRPRIRTTIRCGRACFGDTDATAGEILCCREALAKAGLRSGIDAGWIRDEARNLLVRPLHS